MNEEQVVERELAEQEPGEEFPDVRNLPPDAEVAELRAIVEAGRYVFTCRGCHQVGWRLLIPKHARLGIPCARCGRLAVPDWKCAELLAERAAAGETEEAA